MSYFRNLKNKVESAIEKKKEIIEKKKIEKEMTDTFERYAQMIKEDLFRLNESPQLLNAVALAETFREQTSKIAEDEDLSAPFRYNFLSTVRNWDREIERYIEDMKYRFDFGNKEKFRVESRRSTDYATHIVHALKAIIQEYNDMRLERQKIKEQELEEKERENIREGQNYEEEKQSNNGNMTIEDYKRYGETPPLTLRIKRFYKKIAEPESIPENQEKIEQFREELTEEKKAIIEKQLSKKQDISVLEDYIEKLNELLTSYEEMGHYNHIIALGKNWRKKLEEIADKIRKPEEASKFSYRKESIPELLKINREQYLFLEDWLSRVERKYEKKSLRSEKEPKVEKKEIEEMLNFYSVLRKKRIIKLENRRIIKYLDKKEKIEEKRQREEEKEEEKRLKEIEKEREKEEKEKQKEIERQRKEEEKKRQEEEKEKQKEIERQRKEEEKKRQEEEKEKQMELERQRKKEEKKRQEEEIRNINNESEENKVEKEDENDEKDNSESEK